MNKISLGITNNFCPQTLFIYGTYKEDGTPDFGLFCWFSYVWNDGLGVMACIGGDKMTKDNIRRNKMFSANLVNEQLLPMADYFGNVQGYNEAKMKKLPEIIKGSVLDVPVLADSPVSYELEVVEEINLAGSDVFICKIRNVMGDEYLGDKETTLQERMRRVQPVFTTHQTYFQSTATQMGGWGEELKKLGDEYDKEGVQLAGD